MASFTYTFEGSKFELVDEELEELLGHPALDLHAQRFAEATPAKLHL